MASTRLYRRIAEAALSAALVDTPVVLIHGPRQCGKTTLAQQVGGKRRYRYLTFDDAATLAAARTDITGFVARLERHVILDEVQHVPELFAALKPLVDRNRDSVRLILTGSSNVLLIPRLSDSLAGRMEIIRLSPLSQIELARAHPTFIHTLFSADQKFEHSGREGHALAERIARGGYPVVQKRSSRRREDWYANYIDALVQRDVREMTRIGNLHAIPKLLALAATQTARLVNLSQMASSFELTRPTIAGYLTLIERLFLIEYLVPWFGNRAKRLIKTPKLHFGDTGLACSLLQCSVAELEGQRELLGQLLETFVFGEISRQSGAYPERVNLYHLRDKDGYEVDIVIQVGNKFAGIEVKATSSVAPADFRGLRRLREIVGPRFHCGVVLYDGDHLLPFGDGFLAVPVSALWASRSAARPKRRLGQLKGKIDVADDFNAALPSDVLATFEGH
jgi:predicted AAA+ superfamily ATPase